MTQEIMDLKFIKQRFIEEFGGKPILVSSPGRINLLGEHTDYNDGFVLPAAIDQYIHFALAKSDHPQTRIIAQNLEQDIYFRPHSLLKSSDKAWANYLLGVVHELKTLGVEVPPFNCVFGGDLDSGAGMSSSAAIECGLAFALNELFEWKLSKLDMVKSAQRAENDFVGMNCGIMDQFANMFGKKGQVLKLDCRSLEYDYYPFSSEEYSLVVLNSLVKHSLIDSEYNTRRNECEEGVSILRKYEPSIVNLRDVSFDLLEAYEQELGPVILKRCRYVLEENERVATGCNNLSSGDFNAFGKQMLASHSGQRDKYEVSCREIDYLVDYVMEKDYVFGARMMGGGFGGSSINLVAKGYEQELIHDTVQAYKRKMNLEMLAYIVQIADGTSRME